ncbi:MAG: CerR family C-terminal domain-containing protein [Hyphomicrobiales bacterium]
MTPTPAPSGTIQPGDATSRPDARARLIAAGIDAFGSAGFEAASIRAIASAADVNIAGVSYHFGGKEGLYRACAEDIVVRINERLAPRLARIGETAASDPQEAADAVILMLKGIIRTLLGEAPMDRIARFVVREQMDPTPVFEILYEGIMRPLHTRFCALWALATGTGVETRETQLRLFAIVGQVIVFRIGRATVLGRTGWTGVGEREVAEIEAVVIANTRHVLAAEAAANGRMLQLAEPLPNED